MREERMVYVCDVEPNSRGYRCLKSQLYHILVDYNKSEEDNDLFLDCKDSIDEVGGLEER